MGTSYGLGVQSAQLLALGLVFQVVESFNELIGQIQNLTTFLALTFVTVPK